MPLRQFEAIVPESDVDEVRELMDDEAIVEFGVAKLTDGSVAVRALLPAELVEQLSDRLLERYGSSSTFRVVLSAIEATMPAVADGEDASANGKTDDKKAQQPGRVSREELYQDITEQVDISPVYVATVAISTIVAAAGLLRGDVAIIIGAMVIAPLLGPNVALALAATLGDAKLGVRALRTIAVGVGVATVLSVLAGRFLSVDPTVDEIAARTQVGIGDIVLALAAGAAGALAFTSAVPAALIGVMVAVALLPPLVNAGLLVGAGHMELATGAGLLLVTNVVCVNIAGVVTFLAQRVGPRTWWEEDRARRATAIAISVWVLLLIVLVVIIVVARPQTS